MRLATLMMSTPRGIPGAGRPKRVMFARGITAGGPAPAGPGSFSARTSKNVFRIDAEQEIGPFLNIGIATVFDVPGIEVQIPSLSSPGWILISRGHERFVNEIHRRNSDIVNNSSSLRAQEDNLNDVCFECSKPTVEYHG